MPNVFTQKIGPLPVWGWMGIGTAGLLFVSMGSKGKQGGSQKSNQTPYNPATTPNDTTGPSNALGGLAWSGLGNNGYGIPGNAGWPSQGTPPWWSHSRQYGHTGFPSFGNGWTRSQGHFGFMPPPHNIRGIRHHAPGGFMAGHSGGWGGHMAGPGQHGFGGGSYGIGGQGRSREPAHQRQQRGGSGPGDHQQPQRRGGR